MRKGQNHTEESKQKMHASHAGVPLKEEHRKHIGDSLRGKTGWKLPEDHRKKLSEAHLGQTPWNKGLHGIHSEEQLQKNREWHSGRRPSEATRKKMSERTRLENHPLWKGGISFEPYCPKFNNEFKERVRAFFNHTCQVCGHVWQPGEIKLAVHHVNYDKMVCCNEVKPLFVPVCRRICHSKTNYNREYWADTFTNLILLEHDGECYLPKENE